MQCLEHVKAMPFLYKPKQCLLQVMAMPLSSQSKQLLKVKAMSSTSQGIATYKQGNAAHISRQVP